MEDFIAGGTDIIDCNSRMGGVGVVAAHQRPNDGLLDGHSGSVARGICTCLLIAASAGGPMTAHNHTMQRMRASRLAQSQFGNPWRPARTADGGRSALQFQCADA